MEDKKIIGILGGMGPYATVYFYKKILDAMDVNRDWEYIHTIIDSNPQIPSRTRAYLFNEESPLSGMIESASRLINAGANILTLPCNSAHYFLPKVENSLEIRFVNMLNETSKCVSKLNCTKVGVLATEITVNATLYEKALSKYNISVLQVNKKEQLTVRKIIEDVKKNNISNVTINSYNKITCTLFDRGAEAIILGCTELSIIKDFVKDSENIIDSLDCLVKATMKIAKDK